VPVTVTFRSQFGRRVNPTLESPQLDRNVTERPTSRFRELLILQSLDVALTPPGKS